MGGWKGVERKTLSDKQKLKEFFVIVGLARKVKRNTTERRKI